MAVLTAAQVKEHALIEVAGSAQAFRDARARAPPPTAQRMLSGTTGGRLGMAARTQAGASAASGRTDRLLGGAEPVRPGHASCRAALSTTCLGFSWLLDLASAVSLAAPPRARFPLFCGLVCFTVTEFSEKNKEK